MLAAKPDFGQSLDAPSGLRSGTVHELWLIVLTRLLGRTGRPVPDQARGLASPDNIRAHAASAAIASIRAMRFRSMA
jgi:hypothetical protein